MNVIDNIDWDRQSLSSSFQVSFPWSVELIHEYSQMWNWSKLSANPHLPWSKELVNEYKHEWDWRAMSRNLGLPWSGEFIAEFEELWHWGELCAHVELGPYPDVIGSFLERFREKIEWTELSKNSNISWKAVHYRGNVFEKYDSYWDWYYLSRNVSLPWSKDFIRQHIDKWSWNGLINNEGINWTIDLTDEFAEYFEWNGVYYYGARARYRYDAAEVSQQPSMAFSLHTLKLHTSMWEQGLVSIAWSERNPDPGEWEYFSGNQNLSIEILSEFEDKLNWNKVSMNKEMKWTVDILAKFASRLNWIEISRNEGVWEMMKPNILMFVASSLINPKDSI